MTNDRRVLGTQSADADSPAFVHLDEVGLPVEALENDAPGAGREVRGGGLRGRDASPEDQRWTCPLIFGDLSKGREENSRGFPAPKTRSFGAFDTQSPRCQVTLDEIDQQTHIPCNRDESAA